MELEARDPRAPLEPPVIWVPRVQPDPQELQAQLDLLVQQVPRDPRVRLVVLETLARLELQVQQVLPVQQVIQVLRGLQVQQGPDRRALQARLDLPVQLDQLAPLGPRAVRAQLGLQAVL